MTSASKERGRKLLAPKPGSANAGRGHLHAQGVRTRNAIVAEARRLLLECGSLEFTLREIALRAGISISNLQYYFPNRLSVLRAVLEPVVESYMRDLRRVVDEGAAPRDTLAMLVAKALEDARDEESSALWCQFLSLVATDAESAQMLAEWYETLSHEIAVLVGAVNPGFTPSESMAVATLLIAMADGLSVRVGAGMRHRHHTLALDERILAAVDSLLEAQAPRS